MPDIGIFGGFFHATFGHSGNTDVESITLPGVVTVTVGQ
jgi:hypothetical protein